MERSRKRTFSATGFNLSPSQVLQGSASRPVQSIQAVSCSACSASVVATSTPVPKQLSHQPCFELKENSRGSSSPKLVPQEGHARLVENITGLPFPFSGNTVSRPLP